MRVKLVEYIHETLSLPILSFLVMEHKTLPPAALLNRLTARSMDRREDFDDEGQGDMIAAESQTDPIAALLPSTRNWFVHFHYPSTQMQQQTKKRQKRTNSLIFDF